MFSSFSSFPSVRVSQTRRRRRVGRTGEGEGEDDDDVPAALEDDLDDSDKPAAASKSPGASAAAGSPVALRMHPWHPWILHASRDGWICVWLVEGEDVSRGVKVHEVGPQQGMGVFLDAVWHDEAVRALVHSPHLVAQGHYSSHVHQPTLVLGVYSKGVVVYDTQSRAKRCIIPPSFSSQVQSSSRALHVATASDSAGGGLLSGACVGLTPHHILLGTTTGGIVSLNIRTTETFAFSNASKVHDSHAIAFLTTTFAEKEKFRVASACTGGLVALWDCVFLPEQKRIHQNGVRLLAMGAHSNVPPPPPSRSGGGGGARGSGGITELTFDALTRRLACVVNGGCVVWSLDVGSPDGSVVTCVSKGIPLGGLALSTYPGFPSNALVLMQDSRRLVAALGTAEARRWASNTQRGSVVGSDFAKTPMVYSDVVLPVRVILDLKDKEKMVGFACHPIDHHLITVCGETHLFLVRLNPCVTRPVASEFLLPGGSMGCVLVSDGELVVRSGPQLQIEHSVGYVSPYSSAAHVPERVAKIAQLPEAVMSPANQHPGGSRRANGGGGASFAVPGVSLETALEQLAAQNDPTLNLLTEVVLEEIWPGNPVLMPMGEGSSTLAVVWPDVSRFAIINFRTRVSMKVMGAGTIIFVVVDEGDGSSLAWIPRQRSFVVAVRGEEPHSRPGSTAAAAATAAPPASKMKTVGGPSARWTSFRQEKKLQNTHLDIRSNRLGKHTGPTWLKICTLLDATDSSNSDRVKFKLDGPPVEELVGGGPVLYMRFSGAFRDKSGSANAGNVSGNSNAAGSQNESGAGRFFRWKNLVDEQKLVPASPNFAPPRLVQWDTFERPSLAAARAGARRLALVHDPLDSRGCTLVTVMLVGQEGCHASLGTNMFGPPTNGMITSMKWRLGTLFVSFLDGKLAAVFPSPLGAPALHAVASGGPVTGGVVARGDDMAVLMLAGSPGNGEDGATGPPSSPPPRGASTIALIDDKLVTCVVRPGRLMGKRAVEKIDLASPELRFGMLCAAGYVSKAEAWARAIWDRTWVATVFLKTGFVRHAVAVPGASPELVLDICIAHGLDAELSELCKASSTTDGRRGFVRKLESASMEVHRGTTATTLSPLERLVLFLARTGRKDVLRDVVRPRLAAPHLLREQLVVDVVEMVSSTSDDRSVW